MDESTITLTVPYRFALAVVKPLLLRDAATVQNLFDDEDADSPLLFLYTERLNYLKALVGQIDAGG